MRWRLYNSCKGKSQSGRDSFLLDGSPRPPTASGAVSVLFLTVLGRSLSSEQAAQVAEQPIAGPRALAEVEVEDLT